MTAGKRICNSLKFMISVRGSHCDYSPQEPKKSSYASIGSNNIVYEKHADATQMYTVLYKTIYYEYTLQIRSYYVSFNVKLYLKSSHHSRGTYMTPGSYRIANLHILAV
jgi:hypothetical protein